MKILNHRHCSHCAAPIGFIHQPGGRWVCVDSRPVRYIPSPIGEILYDSRGMMLRGIVVARKRKHVATYKAYRPHDWHRCREERLKRQPLRVYVPQEARAEAEEEQIAFTF